MLRAMILIGVASTVLAGCADDNDGGTTSDGDSALTCPGVGAVHAMDQDPDKGAVDVSQYCLTLINGYRAKQGLAPDYLQSATPEAVCCQAEEAKMSAEVGGHASNGCGWQAQGFCGGGRNPNGTVKASIDWCPRLFFEEGPAGGHYQAMMDPTPRGIMCSFYAVSRDEHSILVNYY
jgi:hypothetical protein